MRLLNKNPRVDEYFIKFNGDEVRIKKVLAKTINPRVTMIISGFVVEHGKITQRGTVEYKPRIFNNGDAVIIKDCKVIC